MSWRECEECGAMVETSGLWNLIHMLDCTPGRAMGQMLPMFRPDNARQLGRAFGQRIKSQIDAGIEIPAPPPQTYIETDAVDVDASEPPEE